MDAALTACDVRDFFEVVDPFWNALHHREWNSMRREYKSARDAVEIGSGVHSFGMRDGGR
jgi:hypothetical protein